MQDPVRHEAQIPQAFGVVTQNPPGETCIQFEIFNNVAVRVVPVELDVLAAQDVAHQPSDGLDGVVGHQFQEKRRVPYAVNLVAK